MFGRKYRKFSDDRELDGLTDQELLSTIARKHPDWGMRLTALRKLDAKDHQPLLAKIAQKDQESWNRREAVETLDARLHQPLLGRISLKDPDESVRYAAVKKLHAQDHQPLLAKIAQKDAAHIRIVAVKNLDAKRHQPLLGKIALKDYNADVRKAAFNRLDTPDQQLLARIAIEDHGYIAPPRWNSDHECYFGDPDIRYDALAMLTDQSLLAIVARKASKDGIREAAVKKLKAPDHDLVLANVVLTDSNASVRKAAAEELARSIWMAGSSGRFLLPSEVFPLALAKVKSLWKVRWLQRRRLRQLKLRLRRQMSNQEEEEIAFYGISRESLPRWLQTRRLEQLTTFRLTIPEQLREMNEETTKLEREVKKFERLMVDTRERKNASGNFY